MSNRKTAVKPYGWEVVALLNEAIAWHGVIDLDKQETPGMAIPEASTYQEPFAEVPGGCSPNTA